MQKNHPYLFKEIKDTVYVDLIDTVYTEGVEFDTIFKADLDTVYLQKDNLKVKFLYKDSVVYLDARCESDTVYIDKQIPIEVVRYKVPPPKVDHSITKWYIVLAIVLSLVAVYVITKFKK